LGDSDNGEQNELDGIDTNDIRMQFYIPSHHFDDSYAIGVEKSPELVVPSSGLIKPEEDALLGLS